LRGQHVDPFSHCSIWLCYTALDLALTHKCTIKKLSDNENINLKIPSFLWQGNLPNRASKIKRSLAHHDIHLLSYCERMLQTFLVSVSSKHKSTSLSFVAKPLHVEPHICNEQPEDKYNQ
jgi:hypothetical protein